MGCPAVLIGSPLFVFSFDATKANFCGGFTDVLEILPGRFGGEAGARGAGAGVESVRHFGLVFGGGVFVTDPEPLRKGWLALISGNRTR